MMQAIAECSVLFKASYVFFYVLIASPNWCDTSLVQCASRFLFLYSLDYVFQF